MRRDSGRTRRVGALLMRELATLIPREVDDSAAKTATVTGVDVAPDFSHAKVFVTHLMGVERARQVVAALNESAPQLRHAIATRVNLRSTPQLRFVYDESVERGVAISSLIDRARAEDEGRND